MMDAAEDRLKNEAEQVKNEREETKEISQEMVSLSRTLKTKDDSFAKLVNHLKTKDKKIDGLRKQVEGHVKEKKELQRSLKKMTLAKNGNGVILDVDGREFLIGKLQDLLKIVEPSDEKGNLIEKIKI